MRLKEVVIIVLLSTVFLEFSIVSIHSTKGKQPVDDVKSKPRTNWDDQNRIKLLKIFYETNTGASGHKYRIKEKWDELHGMEMPQAAHMLYAKVTKYLKKGEAERLLTEEERPFYKYEPRSKLNWTDEMKEYLLELYHESGPELLKQSKRIKGLWDEQYPQYRNITKQALMMQLRSLLEKRRGTKNTKINGLEECPKLELSGCHYMDSKSKYRHLKAMQELFMKKHYQYENITNDDPRHQVHLFQEKHSGIDDKVSREFSTSNLLNPSWAPGETSGSRQEETAYTPRFQGHDFHRRSDQYLGQYYYNPWIHDMTGGPSSSGHHIFPDVGTSQQNIPSGHVGEHSLRGSQQYNPDYEQRESSKEKEPALDLDLHLR